MKAKSLIVSIVVGLSSLLVKADPALVKRVSESLMFQEADRSSLSAAASPDGSCIAFISSATNLSDLDTNGGIPDIYLFDIDAQICKPVSITSTGVIGNNLSLSPDLSREGRFVVFASAADNLVPDDSNGSFDIFVKDMQTGEISRVSVASDGTQANDHSAHPKISADGNLIVFESDADNLVPNDNNGTTDVFVHDRKRGRTWRVSISNDGEEGGLASFSPDISSDGKWITFCSRANNLVEGHEGDYIDVFVCPVKGRNKLTMISVNSSGVAGEGNSISPAISADGRYVVFESEAENLVSRDSNGFSDIFLVDREIESIRRVNNRTSNNDSYSPVVTAEGEVCYYSLADNLVRNDTNRVADVFYYDDLYTNMISRPKYPTLSNGISSQPSVSDDGKLVAFESFADNLVKGDSNGFTDIFYYKDDKLKRASVSSYYFEDSNGASSVPSISSDGRLIVFESDAANLVQGDTNRVSDVFSYNLYTKEIKRLNLNQDDEQANGPSCDPRITEDGMDLVFASAADNLVDDDANGCYDIFYKQNNGAVYRVMGHDGVEPNNHSFSPVPGNNRQVAFYSQANNLVLGDTNGCSDVFFANVSTGSIERVSVNSAGVEGNGPSAFPAMTPDARYIAFISSADNLVDGDTNGTIDVFVYDTEERTIERISVNNEGEQGNGNCWTPDISEDGRYVSFSSNSNNLVEGDSNDLLDVFVYDRQEDTIVRASLSDRNMQANGPSTNARLSATGRYIVFTSEADNLVENDSNELQDVFVRDLRGGHTNRVSMTELIGETDAICEKPVISSNGLNVAFSTTSALAAQDANGLSDIYYAVNPQPALSPGKVFKLSGPEVEGFTDLFFNSKPRIMASFMDPVRDLIRRKRGQILDNVGDGIVLVDGDINCLWKSKVRLFNRGNNGWENNYCRDMSSKLTKTVELQVSTQLIDGTRLENASAGQKLLVPPEISWVVDSVTGEYGVPVEPEQVLQVGGAFFGSKLPKAWLEYRDAKGKLKKAKCNVQRNYFFNDYVGRGGRSCMEVNSGYSVINVQLPRMWPKGWIPGRHDLVIDNGCARAFFRTITE